MAVSWEVWKRYGEWGLFLRDYYAQGLRPDYHFIKKIDEEFAIYLVQEGLAGDLYGQVSDLLSAPRKALGAAEEKSPISSDQR